MGPGVGEGPEEKAHQEQRTGGPGGRCGRDHGLRAETCPMSYLRPSPSLAFCRAESAQGGTGRAPAGGARHTQGLLSLLATQRRLQTRLPSEPGRRARIKVIYFTSTFINSFSHLVKRNHFSAARMLMRGQGWRAGQWRVAHAHAPTGVGAGGGEPCKVRSLRPVNATASSGPVHTNLHRVL